LVDAAGIHSASSQIPLYPATDGRNNGGHSRRAIGRPNEIHSPERRSPPGL
jgi:hypothetical protein